MPNLATLPDLKTHLNITTTTNDAELTLHLSAAEQIVTELVGPALSPPQAYTERVRSSGGQLLLRRYPVVSVQRIGELIYGGGTYGVAAYDIATYYGLAGDPILNAEAGIVLSPFRDATLVEVVYTAGLAVVPEAVRLAVLRYASWKWRRSHGGSETYLPTGDDGSVLNGIGPMGIMNEIRNDLAPYMRASRVA